MLDKIARIQDRIGKLTKDTKGFNYKYFDINQLLERLQPLLREEGLVITQPIIDGSVVTRINDAEEKFAPIESSIKLPENVKPQDLGSAITYYRRYSLVSLLALEAEDDDGAKAMKAPSVHPEVGEGLPKVAFDRLVSAYREKGTMNPDMIEYFEKCNAEQRKEINQIKLELRKK